MIQWLIINYNERLITILRVLFTEKVNKITADENEQEFLDHLLIYVGIYNVDFAPRFLRFPLCFSFGP